MQISRIIFGKSNQIIQPSSFSRQRECGLSLNTSLNKQSSIYSEHPNCTGESIKANFLPSFGKYKTAGKVFVTDRKTGDNVQALIKRDQIGDFVSLKMDIGRKPAGYLDMQCDAVFPEKDCIVPLQSNVIPKVRHLRSLMGDKYSGIGTALIKTAVQESYNSGGRGELWLSSEKGYDKYSAPYRSDENPIPFYYKIGFESPDENIDSFIKECIENSKYEELPDSTLLLLTPEAKEAMLKHLSLNPVIKFKRSYALC